MLKMKKLAIISLIAILLCAFVGIGIGIKNFSAMADEPTIIEETGETEEVDKPIDGEETGEIPPKDDENKELTDKLKEIVAEIKQQRVYKWLVCGLAALLGGLGIVFATVYGKLKSFKAGYKISKKTKDNLEDILKNFDEKSILEATKTVVREEFKLLAQDVLKEAEVKNGELAKIIAEMGITQAQIEKIIEALKLAWNGRVDGIDNVLTEVPTKTAYEKAIVENKLLKEEITELKKNDADDTVAKIEEKASESV